METNKEMGMQIEMGMTECRESSRQARIKWNVDRQERRNLRKRTDK